MDRCALFVDAGYVLTDGAMAVHGTRRRGSVTWDYAGLLQLFGNLAMERTGLPLLRCYWYEATVEGRRSADHDTLADLPGVKLRVAKMRPGRREGVEGEIHRDLTTLARNKAVSDVVVVSAEEDLAQVIADVQDMGLRVTLLHIATGDDRTISRALRQECDDIVEIAAAHLRPYVELISGAEPAQQEEADSGPIALQPMVNGGLNGGGYNGNGINGNGVNGNGVNGNGAAPTRGPGYPQPPSRSAAQSPLPPVPPAMQPPEPARQVPQPAGMEAGYGEPVQHERAEADYAPAADYAMNGDYGAPDYSSAGDHSVPDQVTVVEYGRAPDYGPVPDYAAGAAMPTAGPGQVPPRDDIYPAPTAVPMPVDDPADWDRDRANGRSRLDGDLAAYNPGGLREQQYQRDGMLREAQQGDGVDRLQPVPVPVPSNGAAQVRRLPTRGPGQPPLGLPAAPSEPGQGPMGSQPTGSQPAVPMAPVVPMDFSGQRGGAAGASRHGAPGQGPQVPPGQAPQGPGVPGGPGTGGQVPGIPPEAGAHPGQQGLNGQGGYPGGTPGVSLADAVQSAHEEGQAFGESVARDAPALWLEAVLARKPRMPSDLEARLLQGSTLPIDFLLHDEVRHALRRGFWDALERARR